jgi:hypothetical protein
VKNSTISAFFAPETLPKAFIPKGLKNFHLSMNG